MIAAGLAVFAVWSLLLGVAYTARAVLGLSRVTSSLAVGAAYAGMAAASLSVLGRGWQGWAGCAGMLVPLAAATWLVVCR